MTISLTKNQTEALEKFARLRVGAAFMEQGEGKTLLALTIANRLLKQVDQVLWVGPLSVVRLSTRAEVEKWGIQTAPIRFLGYETLQASERTYLDTLAYMQKGRTLIIADESIFIKNATSKRHRRMVELRKSADFAFILNGTPVTRDLWDLKHQMDFLSPKILDMDDSEFRAKYFTEINYKKVGEKPGKFFKVYEPNVAHLKSLIDPYVYESQLSVDVEEYTTTNYYRPSSETRASYQALKRKHLEDQIRPDVKVLLNGLNKISAEDPDKCELIASSITAPAVVFCTYRTEFDQILSWLPNGFGINGDTPQEERETVLRNAVEQQGVLVLTYGVGAYGLNLQAFNRVHFASRHFDYGKIEQAAKRVRRLGVTGKIVYTIHDTTLPVGEFIKKNLTSKDWLAQIVRRQLDLKELL